MGAGHSSATGGRPPSSRRRASVQRRATLSHIRHTIQDKMSSLTTRDTSHMRGEWTTGTSTIKPRHYREHRKQLRELIAGWSPQDIRCLLAEFDATIAVHELTLQADRARPTVNSLVDDLRDLSKSGIVSDVRLTWREHKFNLHLALLRQRAPLIFDPHIESGTFDNIPLIETIDEMHACVEYIYTGTCLRSAEWVRSLQKTLGTQRSLLDDMRLLYEAGDGETALQIGEESLKCHAFVLAARSPFLRALLERENCGHVIVDPSVLPRIYAPSMLRALYTDELSVEGSTVSSLSQVQAIVSGHSDHAPLFAAQQLLHMAAFLECGRLSHLCEELIIAHCPLHLASQVYDWASESNASPYLCRYVVGLFIANFSKLSSTSLLSNIREDVLVKVLSSDYVQASELAILEIVVKWGELTLVRRMEEREPNIVHGTLHSISRKGVKRSQRVDEELKMILARLVPLVRTEFILPPYHHSLVESIARGLIPLHQPDGSAYGICHMRTMDGRSGSNVDGHWLHTHTDNGHVTALRRPPRAYMPYVEETRAHCHPGAALSEEHACIEGELSSSTSSCSSSHYDDDCCQTVPEWEVVSPMICGGPSDDSASTSHDSAHLRSITACRCHHHRRQARRQLHLARLRREGHRDSLVDVLEHPWKYYEHVTRPDGQGGHDEGTSSSRGTQHDPVAEDTQPLPDVTQDTAHSLH